MNLVVRMVDSIWEVLFLLVIVIVLDWGGRRVVASHEPHISDADRRRLWVAMVQRQRCSARRATRPFIPGDGAEITPQCLICHSAGMVLRQPPLTRDQWVGEINKMRSAYGPALPADQVGRLADYLFRINGSPASHTAANDGGS